MGEIRLFTRSLHTREEEPRSGYDVATVLWVTLAEILDSPLLDELSSILDVASDVSYQTSALVLRQNIAVEVTHLVLVCVCVCVCVRTCVCMYRNLPIIRPWARKLSGSSKRGVGLFSSVLIFHSKVRPPYMLYT